MGSALPHSATSQIPSTSASSASFSKPLPPSSLPPSSPLHCSLPLLKSHRQLPHQHPPQYACHLPPRLHTLTCHRPPPAPSTIQSPIPHTTHTSLTQSFN